MIVAEVSCCEQNIIGMLRTLLTTYIAIGIVRLFTINITSSQLQCSLQYATDVLAQPDRSIFTKPTQEDLARLLAQQATLKAPQTQVLVLHVGRLYQIILV